MPQDNNNPSSASFPSSVSRYPVRIPIRMTQAERAFIGRSATAIHRSISRYLVELAMQGGKPPLQPEDKARIKFLLALFAGTTEKVQTALHSPRLAQGNDAEIVGARLCLQEVLRLLEVIGQELQRRLG